ncbi:FxDxF family PEP-CTERM protein [Duganella fentianensis]|uniref:FxDxF family PEP-CTERM protein n=1 Tax=Duganella fentianensis TaxID=2692177 RepID=UPI0032B18C02
MLKKIAAATMLALSASAAFAATPVFVDTISFDSDTHTASFASAPGTGDFHEYWSLDVLPYALNLVSGSVGSAAGLNMKISFSNGGSAPVYIDDGVNHFDFVQSSSDAQTYALSGFTLQAGKQYTLHLVGHSDNDSLLYSGELSLAAPVPEPETYAMLFAGLGLIGFAARRRKAH